MPGRPSSKLDAYRAKRSAESTPEPFGSGLAARPGLFVVQKHAARHLHYDVRLELGGVLLSWAVPKGPSLDPAEKRLAMHVEDHPVEYADFEGAIPEGNYGAGHVIVWDRGTWIPLEPTEGWLERGKLLFELRGYKLRGAWTLVRSKRKYASERRSARVPIPENEWLLMKKPDAWAAPEGTRPLPQESILSGLTLEELQAGPKKAAEIRAELEALGAPKRPFDPMTHEPMLAETRETAFSDPGWVYELKYDGFRLLAARSPGSLKLFYRRGAEATHVFPDLVTPLEALPFESYAFDGEVVATDASGRPSFHTLQQRVMIQRRADIERAAVEIPATYYVFDLLHLDGFDLRGLPLKVRKDILRRVLPRTGPLRFVDHIEERGEAVFGEVQKLGLEGMVAKRSDSTYRPGVRSPHWVKVRVERTGDFVVVGYTEPRGTRSGFGGLDLAAWSNGGLVYVGRVGSGFSQRELGEIRARLDRSRRKDPPCGGPVPKERGHRWVEPELVCEVRFKEWTDVGILREPRFLRFRDDKAKEQCTLDRPLREAPVTTLAPPERVVKETNRDKVFWPEEGKTKGDLLDYYRAASKWLLPYLRERPLVLTRYPDGIKGKMFYQHDVPRTAPGWLRTERMWSETAGREIDHFVCDDLEALLYIINMGSIPLHIWASRCRSIQSPDWLSLDLDPKEASFAHVITVAKAIRELCEAIELPSFPKTSGSSGLHVMIPLGGRCTYVEARTLAELLAAVVVQELPEIATTARLVEQRKGRVYIDYMQNGLGRTLASPLCVRPVPGARVSTPLEWREVNAKLDPQDFTIDTVPERLEKKGDPMAPLLEVIPDLPRVLERLGARVARRS